MATDFEAFEAWVMSNGEIPFDIYSQDPNEWTWLQDIIPNFIVSSAGGSVPFQAEGLYHGYPFYMRDRHGYAELSLGELDGEAPYSGSSILYSAGVETEEFYGSENFIRNILALVPKLKRAPFPYQFEGKKLDFSKDNSWTYTVSELKKEICWGWGYTPEEGFARLVEPSEYLITHGASVALQQQMMEAQAFSPIPVNSDERKFPDSDPLFIVTV